MLLRIGNVEAEIKVACVMSAPRLGFLDNFFCVSTALAPHKISPIKVSGAFWGQCLQRGMEQVIDTHDVILTVDYDTVFSSRTVEAMLALLMHSGMDALAPLQIKRESDCLMFCPKGIDVTTVTTVQEDWFKQPVQPVLTAHFGLTFIRTEALKKMPKPWFVPSANAIGEYTPEHGGYVDEDLYFWKSFCAVGNKLGMATNISVGHAELMVTWPTREAKGPKIHQHTTEYWNSGQKAPEGTWGAI